MKKISLFAIVSSAALMTACTDYVSKIEDLQAERSVVYVKKTFTSGCTCKVNEGNLVEAYGKKFYKTSSNLPTISFALTGCSETPARVYRKSSSYDNQFVNNVSIYNNGAWWVELNLTQTAVNASLPGSVINYLDVENDEGAEDLVICPEISFGYKEDADEQQTSATPNTSSTSTTVPVGQIGTCAPNKSSAQNDERIQWTFEYNMSSGFKAVDFASATIDWQLTGGSPSEYSGLAGTRTANTTYPKAGFYSAVATVNIAGSTQTVYCKSVIVNETYSASTNSACGDLWCGRTDFSGKVETGFDNETAGLWYDYNDVNDAGTSSFTYPADVETNEYGNFFGPLIEAYGGIKGTVTIGAGYDYPYAGLAFNVVSESQEGGDISGWGGICLVYKSTLGFSLELGVEDEADVTGYNNYKATLSRETSMAVHDVGWDKFKQESGWGETADRDYVLEHVSTIRLKFSGTAGTTGDFLIQSIGRYGTCK